MQFARTLLISASALMMLGSAYAEQRVCWGTKMQSVQSLSVSFTCTRKSSASDEDVNAYVNTLSPEDKEDLQDECDGVEHNMQIPSDWLESPLMAQDGALYSVYGSWGVEQDDPMASSTMANLYEATVTVSLGSCQKTLSASDWANSFVPSRDNQVLVCDNDSFQIVPGLTCSSFDY